MQILFDQADHFLKTPSPLLKAIIVYGPTACGKTAFSIELAKMLDTEIIGADSRQIYRYLDIGTGKVTKEEKQDIPHHMIDIRDPDEEYSVGEYQKNVLPIMRTLHESGKVPILCGWTGLYLDSIAFHFDIPAIEPDWIYRDELEKIRLEKGNKYLWNLLHEVDPEYAKELHYNNHRYVARALEVLKETGTSKQTSKSKKEPLFDILLLTPYDGDRAKLYGRINTRVEGMFEQWLVDEVQGLLDRWYTNSAMETESEELGKPSYLQVNKKAFGLNTIGYKETIEYLRGNISLERCKELVKQGNRNYAKRQLTWFRRYEKNENI